MLGFARHSGHETLFVAWHDAKQPRHIVWPQVRSTIRPANSMREGAAPLTSSRQMTHDFPSMINVSVWRCFRCECV